MIATHLERESASRGTPGPAKMERSAMAAVSSVFQNGFAVALVCTCLFSLIIFRGLAANFQETSPSLALMAAPGDGQAMANIALRSVMLKARDDAAADGNALSGGPAGRFVNNAMPDPRQALTSGFQLRDKTVSAKSEILNSKVYQLALAALKAESTNTAAFVALALSFDQRGEKDTARTLMRHALNKSKHNSQALLWLLVDGMVSQHYSEAIGYLSIFYKISPRNRPRTLEMLSILADDPAARPVLVQKLAGKPGWAFDFLKAYPRLTKAPSRLSELVNQVSSTGYIFDRPLLSTYMASLIRGGQYDSAFYIWLQTLTAAQLSTLPPVFNGDFEKKLSGSPFDWVINTQAGVEAGIDASSGPRKNNVFSLRFMGDRVQPKQLSQYLRLTPGAYQMSADYRFLEFINSRGLVWSIKCLGGKATAQLHSERLKSISTPWRRFVWQFRIPDENCEAQELVLALAARNRPESIATGSAWFDNIVVRKQQD